MTEERADDALSRLLRAGDPAAGEPSPSRTERSALRRWVLAAGRERRRRPNGWLVPATAALALLALALGLAWRGTPGPALETAELPAARATTAAATPADAGQQVQFTTENGTLVVWVLMPRSTS